MHGQNWVALHPGSNQKGEKNVVEAFMISWVPEMNVAYVTYSVGENLVGWPYKTTKQQVNVDQLGSHVSSSHPVNIKEEDNTF